MTSHSTRLVLRVVPAVATTLLRGVPDDVMAYYEGRAAEEGVSCNALLVRMLVNRANQDERGPRPLVELQASAERARDLLDPAVVRDAWS